jgi:hypothetical protein
MGSMGFGPQPSIVDVVIFYFIRWCVAAKCEIPCNYIIIIIIIMLTQED